MKLTLILLSNIHWQLFNESGCKTYVFKFLNISKNFLNHFIIINNISQSIFKSYSIASSRLIDLKYSLCALKFIILLL